MRKFAHFLIFLYVGAITQFKSGFCSGEGNRADFFDEPRYEGNSLTLSITGGCYRFKRKWMGRVQSILVNPGTPCLMAWVDADCGGKALKLTPKSEYNWDLRQAGFEKQIKSVSLCYEISFRAIDVEDRMTGEDKDEIFISRTDDISARLEINFYDKARFEGNILTVDYYEGCYTFKPKWMSRISSVELEGKCMTFWDRQGCEGASVTLDGSNTEATKDLSLVDFDKRTKSISICAGSRARGSSAPFSDEVSSSGSFENQPRNRNEFRYRGRDDNKENSRPSSQQYDDVMTDDDIVKVALNEHNSFRKLHGVPDLAWDSKIQKTAQSFANYLAQNNQFQHSNDNDYGENLGGISTQDKISALKQVIRLWYNEIQNYDFSNPSHSVVGSKAGHFTQLVWRTTTHVGVGMAWNPRRNWWVVVANYDPPGNFKGTYKENVLPPRD